MRPHLRWYWAASITFIVWFTLATGWMWLTSFGPLESVSRRAMSLCPGRDILYSAFIILWYNTPPFVVALVVYGLLRPGTQPDDEYLHCLKCGYILKGLSEPRCPECGERI